MVRNEREAEVEDLAQEKVEERLLDLLLPMPDEIKPRPDGAPARRARRRAISVFPTPVGPMRMMLLGEISSRMLSGARCRRHRFLSAMATAFLASFCPTM
jgi:hypothetical protein